MSAGAHPSEATRRVSILRSVRAAATWCGAPLTTSRPPATPAWPRCCEGTPSTWSTPPRGPPCRVPRRSALVIVVQLAPVRPAGPERAHKRPEATQG